MLISRTPCRICLVGGGTDVSDFYRHEDYGAVVTCAIAPYVYVVVGRRFDARVRVAGVATADCASAAEVQHPLVREALLAANVGPGIDVAAFSEVPEGTGLASSSALTVGLLHALWAHKHGAAGTSATLDPAALAEAACAIEIDRLGGNAGKLDQFSTAIGGLLHIRFNPDETTICAPIAAPGAALRKLEEQMMLFFTGQTRQASGVMAGWRRGMAEKRPVLRRMRDQADQVAALLADGDIDSLGPILDEAWRLKKGIADGITSPEIDAMYEAALRAGATGGKLSGAGGGGFLMVMCPAERQGAVREALAGCAELRVRVACEGTTIVCAE
jgi:D-glycero-alpha-D-manno-heptose-7-phosphate kinase